MLYRVEALESLSDGQTPRSDAKIIMSSYALVPDDVFKATFRFLLCGHWVKITNGRSGQPISGLFNPANGLPTPDAILPKGRKVALMTERAKLWQEANQQDQQLVFSPEPTHEPTDTVHK